jgi:hypothetical protein
MALIKQSTTYVRTFFAVQSSDHITLAPGISLSVSASKNGGTFGSVGSITEISGGWYKLSLTATDTNTLGDLAVFVSGSGVDPVLFVDQVIAVDLMDPVGFGLSRIDAAISSRSTFAGGAVASVTAPVTVGTNNDKTGYALTVSPPTVVQIRQEMDTNSSRLDVAVSTRSTYSGGAVSSVTAPVTVGTNNDKTGYALTVTPPTAVQIRQEVDLNSTKLDVAVSTRSTYNGGPVASVTGAVGSVTGNVSGNVIGSVGSVLGSVGSVGTVTSVTNPVDITQGAADKVWGSAARTLTSFGTLVTDMWNAAVRTLTSSAPLSSTDKTAIIDGVLGKDLSTVTTPASRSLLNAVRFLRNKWIISNGVLTVKAEDDTATAWTATVSTTPGSDPITTVDPV